MNGDNLLDRWQLTVSYMIGILVALVIGWLA